MIFNLDSDPEALLFGEFLVKKFPSIQNLFSVEGSFVTTQIRGMDIGWLIGVLCGMTPKQCIALLRILKKNFKKGGILAASSISPEMEKKDPIIFRLATGIGGWPLVPKTRQELEIIFKKAGYDPVDSFSDIHGFHNMVVGKLK